MVEGINDGQRKSLHRRVYRLGKLTQGSSSPRTDEMAQWFLFFDDYCEMVKNNYCSGMQSIP